MQILLMLMMLLVLHCQGIYMHKYCISTSHFQILGISNTHFVHIYFEPVLSNTTENSYKIYINIMLKSWKTGEKMNLSIIMLALNHSEVFFVFFFFKPLDFSKEHSDNSKHAYCNHSLKYNRLN